MTIGAAVREAREAEGITQEALAHDLSLTKGAVQHIEAGRRQPSHRVLMALALRFGWQLRWEPSESGDSATARERSVAILGTLGGPVDLVSVSVAG